MKLLKKPVWLRASIAAVGAVAGIHLLSALTLDRQMEYREISVRSDRIDLSLDGYTIAFLTDVHGATDKVLAGIVERLNERGVDLVLLGGDYPRRTERVGEVLERFAGIEAPDGFYGVEGNHDSADALRAEMERRNMRMLDNEGLRLRGTLYLGGVVDLRNRDPDPQAAVAGAGAEDFVLLLSHNPDVASRRDLTGVDLMLSGHTHGGEVSLFGLWSPAVYLVSDYGQHYRTGWCRSPQGVDVYVSNGVGNHLPLRSFVRPQVILLTLEHGA